MPTDMPRSKKGASRHTDCTPPGQHYSAQAHADREKDQSLRLKIERMKTEAKETPKIGATG